MTWLELRTMLTIFIMFIVPGWAILSVTNLWRRFEVIERWILAVGLSIAFYPFVYYLTRAILPSVRIGQNKLTVLLVGLFALTAWMLKKKLARTIQAWKIRRTFPFHPGADAPDPVLAGTQLPLPCLDRCPPSHPDHGPGWYNRQASVRSSTLCPNNFRPVPLRAIHPHWQPPGVGRYSCASSPYLDVTGNQWLVWTGCLYILVEESISFGGFGRHDRCRSLQLSARAVL